MNLLLVSFLPRHPACFVEDRLMDLQIERGNWECWRSVEAYGQTGSGRVSDTISELWIPIFGPLLFHLGIVLGVLYNFSLKSDVQSINFPRALAASATMATDPLDGPAATVILFFEVELIGSCCRYLVGCIKKLQISSSLIIRVDSEAAYAR